MSILSAAGFEFLMRWGHFLAGITWIGLLYYFNFVQGEYFKEATPDAKADAVKKLVPRVLWWFRWGAMFTFLTGTAILLRRYCFIAESRVKERRSPNQMVIHGLFSTNEPA